MRWFKDKPPDTPTPVLNLMESPIEDSITYIKEGSSDHNSNGHITSNGIDKPNSIKDTIPQVDNRPNGRQLLPSLSMDFLNRGIMSSKAPNRLPRVIYVKPLRNLDLEDDDDNSYSLKENIREKPDSSTLTHPSGAQTSRTPSRPPRLPVSNLKKSRSLESLALEESNQPSIAETLLRKRALLTPELSPVFKVRSKTEVTNGVRELQKTPVKRKSNW